MFELHQHKTRALFFKPSFERLEKEIKKAAPDLDIYLIDEEGRFYHQGEEVAQNNLHPDFFWIHSELFASPILKDYFKILSESANVKWLHTINTGLDKEPYLKLLKKNIRITNNHSQAIAIAEYVMAHVMSWFQKLPDFEKNQSQHTWKYRTFREIYQTRWVILGFGHIGQQIARRAKAFGVHITAVRRGKSDEGLADEVVDLDALKNVLGNADVVVLACASNAETRNIVDRKFLTEMKNNSVLINIARGDLVVEEDLKNALDSGHPSKAIIDVFDEEPLPETSWFWDHPAVSLTPHCSNAGSGMRHRSDELFLENLYRISNGQLLLNEVTKKDIL